MDTVEKQILKDWRFWRDSFFACLLLVVYNVGAMLGQLYFYKTEKLWFPYVFGGMPSYAVGNVGVKWWNQIYIFINATETFALNNPLIFGIFLMTIFWMYDRYTKRKKIWLNYILVLFVEIFMIFTTEWK